jgi:hypothetical protein
MPKTKYYLFNQFPGLWPKWTLAVLAVGLGDARTYVKATHRGGKFCGEVNSGDVKADCGAVTEAAQAVLHEKMERRTAGDFEQETYF